MVRSYWIGPLFGVLAMTGLARSDTPIPADAVKTGNSTERFVTVGDVGKPGQKCRVLKTWTMPSGHPAYQVQALDTGELMTIEETESAPAATPGAVFRPKAMRIFRWGRDAQASPHGSPEPPANAVVIGMPSNSHSTTKEPPLVASAPDKAHGNWPPAFAVKNAEDSIPAAAVKPAAPVAPPVAKKIELTPLRPTPAAVKPVQAATVVALNPASKPQGAEKPVASPTEKKPADVNFWKAAPTAKTAVTPPATAKSAEPLAVKAPAKPAEPLMVKASPVTKVEVAPMAKTAAPPTESAKPAEPVVVKAPPAKVEATPAKPSDWRESWGKIPAPKSAPIPTEEHKVAKAASKAELPHAAVKADDPLRTPEKYSKLPSEDDGAFGKARAGETKRPLLAMLALNAPAPLPQVEEKKPVRAAAANTPSPSATVTPVAATVPAETAPVVKIAPPTPAQIVPPVMATPELPAPIELPPVPAEIKLEVKPDVKTEVKSKVKTEAKPEPKTEVKPEPKAEVKPEAKPAVPLGMQSVLAVHSPELAPPVPQKPAAASQAQAMGIGANEPNAFSSTPPAGQAIASANSFWSPRKAPPPAANPQTEATAWNPLPLPPRYAQAAPPASQITQAEYKQDSSYQLAQLSLVMWESQYPSQREWAAERLASIDWHRQPQVLDLLMERAKQDPAPMVRAECVRSLARMKCDVPAVAEALKSFQADADAGIRQAAHEAGPGK